ncbi:MAG: M3 family oligoendopeptidase [Spirochaetia bacterium]|jgi:pepF/M3 family oligoendopeptidase|nr:M3 family oligoendopeptidase [Spirochaetia bacterium]
MNMKWNLDALYTSFKSDNFLSDITELDRGILELIIWADETLLESAAVQDNTAEIGNIIRKYLDSYINIRKLYSALFSYAELTFSVDASNNTAKKYTEILEQKLPDMTKSAVQFTRWISLVKKFKKVIKNSGLLKEHSFYLEEIRNNSRYLLSDKEEILAAKLKNTGSNAWSQLWNVMTSTVKVDIEIDGGHKELPLPVVRNMANEADCDTRKKAFNAEFAVYKKFEEAAAAALNGVKGEVITISKLRGYKSPLEMTLINSRMDEKTLNAMFSAIKEYLPGFRKYFHKKAELLGHSKGLPFHDLFAPMEKTIANNTKEKELTFTYDQAKKFIVNKFRDFSDNLADYAENAFENSWIDAEQREGKRGGAFCENLHVIGESRIMSNFDGSFSGVTTLAHELGHGYHGHCLIDESFLNSDYPMPLAETASIFCETLIINAAIKNASESEAYTILENSIQSDAQVIVDIYSRYLFESELFEKRKSSSLSVEELKNIMLNAQKESYGDGLDQDQLHPYMWACKPHYYYADFNFYNFPYAFGLLFAKGLYAEYLKTGKPFIEKYDTLLRETGKNTIADVTAMMGIDIQSPEFWKSSLELTKIDIEKFIASAE